MYLPDFLELGVQVVMLPFLLHFIHLVHWSTTEQYSFSFHICMMPCRSSIPSLACGRRLKPNYFLEHRANSVQVYAVPYRTFMQMVHCMCGLVQKGTVN